eukprot:CAMPEP_0181108390 /NCGR_PEP_ID=MMETSP1071-20121207/17605_1 /TAXON_ID=35127 /ORGANISM="Thalassiosira sp., Strain NH16" /LENGTH=739 /DNA_ID=CAMNT_0023191991 /DNA_START=109 /DNA_END=2325 /DNA_ORIENTATION=+
MVRTNATAASNNDASSIATDTISVATGITSSQRSGGSSSRRSKELSSSNSKTSNKSKMDSQADVAALRHLRSIVKGIASDENISPADRSHKIKNFGQLLEQAENRLHFNEKKMDDPLALFVPLPDAKPAAATKKKGWLKARLLGGNKQQQASPQFDNNMSRSDKFFKDQKNNQGLLETLEEEARGDMEDRRKRLVESRSGTSSNKESERSAPPMPEKSRSQEDDATEGTCTDSIIDMRVQNSEDYNTSVCSLRSLGTFEKDFITNIIAEQAGQDETSVCTFEQDFMARQAANGGDMPKQVYVSGLGSNPQEVIDDVTVGTILSETTFEKDARSIVTPRKDSGGDQSTLPMLFPPMQVVTTSNGNTGIDDGMVHDDFTVGSETTFERDRRVREQEDIKRVGSAPTTFAVFEKVNGLIKNVLSGDSELSISTFEKDAAALNALAAKIGRTPSTKTKVSHDIVANSSDRSCSTFEKDAAARLATATVNASSNNRIGIVANQSKQLTSTFEKDSSARAPKSQLSAIDESVNNTPAAAQQRQHPPPSPSALAQSKLVPMVESPLASQVTSPASPSTVGLASPPSRTAFEDDVVVSVPENLPTANSNILNAIHPGWFDSIERRRQHQQQAGGGAPMNDSHSRETSLSGFERDARSVNNNSSKIPEGGGSYRVLQARSNVTTPTTNAGASVRSRGLSAAAHSACRIASSEAVAKLPKISELVVELSPNAIDKGVKSREALQGGNIW